MAGRALLLALGFLVLAGTFVARLAQLQLVDGDRYANAVADARLLVDLRPARRGRILDREGRPLADNRAVYDFAVVLADLEVERRSRYRVPFLRFDRSRLDRLVADISLQRGLGLERVRERLVAEFELCPAVALRHGRREREMPLGLLAIPREVLVAAERDASAGADPRWQALAESGLVESDPRLALGEEFLLRHDQRVDLLDEAALVHLVDRLARQFDVPANHLRQVIDPELPRLTLAGPGGAEEPIATWLACSEDRRQQLVDRLARFLSRPARLVREHLDRQLRRARPQLRGTGWLYVPAARISELGERLPSSAPVREVAVVGDLPARERIFLVQADTGADGFLPLLLRRLAAALELDPADTEWLAALLATHGEEIGYRTAERDYRVHQAALDAGRVRRLCQGLAAALVDLPDAPTALELEQRLCQVRRSADREWRGSTRHDPLPVVEDVPHRLARQLAGRGRAVPPRVARDYVETEAELPGLRVVTRMGREYPKPGTASHLIGHLGRLSSVYDRATALVHGLDPEGWLGRAGLEATYDHLLQGVGGRRVRLRTFSGYRELFEAGREPIPGVDIELVLDLDLQVVAESALGRWFELAEGLGLATEEMRAARGIGAGRAGLVLQDLRDGGVLALASRPGFDLGQFSQRFHEWSDPQLHPGQPLHDHACDAAQPPGSTVKPLIALIALADGKVTPSERIHSPGYMLPGVLREHGRWFRPRHFTIVEAIAKSSNVVFAKLAERIGKERLPAYLRRFGFGSQGAVDIDWQRPGLLPDPASIRRLRPREPVWYPSDTWRMGIGQFLSSSPLQVVAIGAAIATGGTYLRPYLARRAAPRSQERILRPSRQALAVVQRGMEEVAAPGGTASRLSVDLGAGRTLPVAAKTGTSEWGNRASREAGTTPDHAWLVGYAPARRPRVAFACFVHSGTSGGRACTGVVKAVLEAYFAKYGA